MKWVRLAEPHIHNLTDYKHNDNRGGFPYKPGDFLEVSSPYHAFKPV